jgi:hypothetical protein
LGGIVKQRDHSWLELLGFFVMTTLASSLVLAAVFAGVTVAVAGGASAQRPDNLQVDPMVPGQIFSGTITDAHCGSRHTDSALDVSECVRMCARNGSRYVIAGNDGNYELAGDPEQFSALAGRRVNLVGVLHGNTITVSSARLQGRPSSYSGGDSQERDPKISTP